MASSLDPRNLFDLKGIVAVITGGGSGIGHMIAKTLAVNGAERVYILGRRAEVLDAGAKKSGTTNIIVPIVTDVTSKESLMAAATQIASGIGYVNVVIANAGQGGPRHQFTPETSIAEFQSALWNVDFNEYLQTFATNTAGVWYTVVAFLDLLDKGNKKGNVTQSSQVISLGSVAGFNRATPGNYAYAQSKAATTHLMKQLATALVRYGIRSNMIAPGLYPSDTAAPMLARFNNVFPKTIVPVERIGTEEDMAGCILYLTSKAGAYLSGAVMLTDGGSLSILPATY